MQASESHAAGLKAYKRNKTIIPTPSSIWLHQGDIFTLYPDLLYASLSTSLPRLNVLLALKTKKTIQK